MRNEAKEVPLNKRDREAADDWMRDHMPDPGERSLEDGEEAGTGTDQQPTLCLQTA